MPELWKVHFSRKCSLFGEKRVENSDTAKEMNTYIGASENEWKKGTIIINWILTKILQHWQCITARLNEK